MPAKTSSTATDLAFLCRALKAPARAEGSLHMSPIDRFERDRDQRGTLRARQSDAAVVFEVDVHGRRPKPSSRPPRAPCLTHRCRTRRPCSRMVVAVMGSRPNTTPSSASVARIPATPRHDSTLPVRGSWSPSVIAGRPADAQDSVGSSWSDAVVVAEAGIPRSNAISWGAPTKTLERPVATSTTTPRIGSSSATAEDGSVAVHRRRM